jgi:hypothetical protein
MALRLPLKAERGALRQVQQPTQVGHADVVELVDTPASSPGAQQREGPTPSVRTCNTLGA